MNPSFAGTDMVITGMNNFYNYDMMYEITVENLKFNHTVSNSTYGS